ncbi:MAG: protease family protein [Verrucomicrobiota bacterium]|jgi:membrane protease YdiL (CAAX protease family)
MTDQSVSRARISSATWIGLFLSIFAILIIRQAVSYFWPTLIFTAVLWKESLIWLCAIVLLVIIRRGERLPFTSIGIGTAPLWKSILWGLVLAVICGAVGAAIAVLTHFNGGKTGEALDKLPVWLVTLIVIRAGVVEELFYRGYAIERLQALGLNRYWAAAVPLIIFSLGHWTGGWPNIVIALALGAVLSGFYLWRRDLVTNMIGHFMVDFVANVLPKMFPHS